MQLSTRGRYAVMALLDLAELQKEHDKPVTLAQIADRQKISLSYLEQLFAKLRRSGVVDSVRGPGGGYVLAQSAEETWLADVIHAVNEEIDMTRCGALDDRSQPHEGHGCVAGSKCNAHDLWLALGVHLEAFLRHISLAMVLRGEFTPSVAVSLTGDAQDETFHVRMPAKIS